MGCVVPDTILITGGAGFIGSSLAIDHKRRSPADRVVAVDNLKRRGAELNLARLREAGVEFRHADVRQPEDLAFGDRLDAIIECSAEPSVMARGAPPACTFRRFQIEPRRQAYSTRNAPSSNEIW